MFKNLANILTLLRIVCAFFFIWFVLKQTLFFNFLAMCIFIIAGISDYLDGFIARRTNAISGFGKLLDPVADKIFVLGAFISFVRLSIVPVWVVVVIIFRELLVTGLRVFAAYNGKLIPAEISGKHKTAWQMGVVFFILLWLLLNSAPYNNIRYFLQIYEWFFKGCINMLMFIVLAITLWSGWKFLWNNKEIIG